MKRSCAILMAVLLAAVAAAGCLAGPAPTDSTVEAAPERPGAQNTQVGRPPEVSGPTGDPHGEPRTEEGPVRTEMTANGWQATQIMTFENGVGTAAEAAVRFGIGAGSIDVRSDDVGSYRIELVLEARGATEEDARRGVESAQVEFVDELGGRTMDLRLHVSYPPIQAGLLSGILGGGRGAAHLTAVVPLHLAYDVGLGAGSGSIAAEGLAGTRLGGDAGSGDIRFAHVNFGRIEADTGSGKVTIQDARATSMLADTGSGQIAVQDAVAHRLEASSGSGRHDVEGSFDHVKASSGSGRQTYGLTAGTSGSWSFEAGSGRVTVELQRAHGQAYDITAKNGSGSISIDIDDGEPVGPQDGSRAHVRSAGFGQATIQTTIDASTGSGDIRAVE